MGSKELFHITEATNYFHCGNMRELSTELSRKQQFLLPKLLLRKQRHLPDLWAAAAADIKDAKSNIASGSN